MNKAGISNKSRSPSIVTSLTSAFLTCISEAAAPSRLALVCIAFYIRSALTMNSSPTTAFASSAQLHLTHTTSTHFASHVCATTPSPKSPAKRPRQLTRRAAVASLVAAAAAASLPRGADAIDLYKVGQIRYIPTGRPKADGPPPEFDATVKCFPLGAADSGLEAQDAKVGDGKVAGRGSLVVARWLIRLEDGTVVEETDGNEMFRLGVGQVYPGLDAVLDGVREGGLRKVRGPATSFFSDITSGERSLVESRRTVFADVELVKIDPFGTGR